MAAATIWLREPGPSSADHMKAWRCPQVINSDDNEPSEGLLISKARMLDAKVDPVEPEPEDGSTDTESQGVLEDCPDDATMRGW
jgi:hypothetical protein